MIDDLMARTMVENLSIGINPITGEALSSRDCCSNPIVQEAIKVVLETCTIESYASILEKQRKEKIEMKEEKARIREQKYPRNGIPWTKEEELDLECMLRKGYPIPRIANTLKRTPSAIASHIKKASK